MLSARDQELIAAASEAIKRRYRNDWQEVGAALRTRDGRIYAGVNLDAYLGRMAVCAEAVALGQAVTETGETGIDTIVAVRHPEPGDKDQAIVVVSPGGTILETYLAPADAPMRCAFGDADLGSLYVTAGDGGLYRAKGVGRRGLRH